MQEERPECKVVLRYAHGRLSERELAGGQLNGSPITA